MIRRLSLLLLCALLQALTPVAAALHATQHLASGSIASTNTGAAEAQACPEHAAQAAAALRAGHKAPTDHAAGHGCCSEDCHCVAPALGALTAMRLPAAPPAQTQHAQAPVTSLADPAPGERLRPPIAA